MNDQNYTKIITAQTTPDDAFAKICRVSDWWAKNFEGKTEKVDDIFTVHFPNGDMYKCKVTEFVPGEKIVWDVIDAYQGWVKNPIEWKGTKIIWKISPIKDGITLKMTHEGLTPTLECFHQCTNGWNYLNEKSLLQLLDTNEGMPV